MKHVALTPKAEGLQNQPFFAETKLDFLWVKLKFWLSIPSSQSYLIFYTFPLKKYGPIEDWPYLRPPAMLFGN